MRARWRLKRAGAMAVDVRALNNLVSVGVVVSALAMSGVCAAQQQAGMTQAGAAAMSAASSPEQSPAEQSVAQSADVGSAARELNPFAAPWRMSARPADAVDAPRPTVRVPSLVWQYTEVEPSDPQKAATGISARLEKARKLVSGKYDVTRIGDRGIGKGLNFYSLDKEVMMGKELSEEVEKHSRLFGDPRINEYINRLAQNLVRNSDAKVPFTVKIIDSDEVNAFALPGGFFYINTGLILAADNEAELAGVMAHEIAHVAARHATKMATKKDIWDIASIPLIFVGGPAGVAVHNFVSMAVPMSFMKFSRNAESEADLLGMEYQYAAGYDPAEFIDFFEKIAAQEKQRSNLISRAFSTHPMTSDRIKKSEKVLATMLPANDQYLVTTSDFEEMKARLARLTTGRRVDELKPGKPTLRKSVAESVEESVDAGGPMVR